MSLFTLVLEFRGATLIHQVVAEDPAGAIQNWARELPRSSKRELREAAVLLAEEFAAPDPTALKGLCAVWCESCSIDNDLALLHIVRTAPS